MLRRNTALTVSPTEQMYFVNRNAGLGDPLTSAIISIGTKALSLFKSLFGGGGDPNKDIHIPAQNAAVSSFGQVLNQLDAKKANGSLTVNDIQQGYQTIVNIDAGFKNLTDSLSAQHPEFASRYHAGYSDVHNLEQQILAGMNPAHYGISASTSVLSSLSLTNPDGGVSAVGMALLTAGILFLPKLFSGRS
jgi:hypothetical protein